MKIKRCVVCSIEIQEYNLCKNCWLAAKLLKNNPELIKRLYAYFGGRKIKMKLNRKNSRRNTELTQLIKSQRADAHDRNIRFEHAIRD